MKNTIEVNGIKYIPKEKPKVQNKSRLNSKMLPFMAMGMMFTNCSMPIMYDPFMPKEKKEPQRPDVNIIKEYGLIQLKKSELSRAFQS